MNLSTNHAEKYPYLRYIVIFNIDYNWSALPISWIANIFIIDVEFCQPRQKIKKQLSNDWLYFIFNNLMHFSISKMMPPSIYQMPEGLSR